MNTDRPIDYLPGSAQAGDTDMKTQSYLSQGFWMPWPTNTLKLTQWHKAYPRLPNTEASGPTLPLKHTRTSGMPGGHMLMLPAHQTPT